MKVQTKHTQIFFYCLCFGFLILLIYSIFLYSNQVYAENIDDASSTIPLVKNSQIVPPKQNLGTTTEKIQAKSYIIYDIRNQKTIRGQNASTPLPIASLTKVITVGTFLEMAKQNKIELREETKIRIKKALIQSSNQDADSLGYIYKNSFGTDLLADSNKFIESLGIVDLKITNLTGLDNYDGTASNIGSAESIAKVFAYVYEHNRDVFEYTKFEEVEGDFGKIKNTNQGIEKTFGIIASKTGYTLEAGGNLGVIVSPEPGSSYVIVVMNSTKEGRFEDVSKIVKLLPIILKN